jgi:signal transduction histidine kinase
MTSMGIKKRRQYIYTDPKNATSDEAGPLMDLGFKAVIDALPCYLTLQDRSLRILFSNQTFKNDFGDSIGKLCHVVYKDNPKRCESCPVQKTFHDRGVHISEESVQLLNGEFADLIVYSSPILDVFGNVAAVIEISTNITKVKEIQKELKLLGQSMAMISHDIKNILEGLQGGVYVVEEGLKDNDMDLAGRGWEIVKRNINEVTDVVQNILYAAKKRDPQLARVSPVEIVESVVAMFREKAKAMGIQLTSLPNTSLPTVRLDGASIKRMLNNLIWNALEACTKDKSKDFHKVSVRADFYDQWHMMFEVEDNGTGMDEETQKNLFQEFYSTKGVDGTGLGLLVVDKIAKEHGGKIELLTTPGKGCTFRIIFKIH